MRCLPLTLMALLGTFTATLPASALEKTDVPYAQPVMKEHQLDLNIPDGHGPFTAVIMIHGGGFDTGDKGGTGLKPLLNTLSQAGVAWFSINYRMGPDYHLPQAIEDVNASIRWVKEHAAEYHVNPRKIVIAGESAGGYLAGYAATHPEHGTELAAVLDFYGGMDYVTLTQLRHDHPERFDMKNLNGHIANGGGIRFFGVNSLDDAGWTRLKEVSPYYAVRKGVPPFLIIHGNADDQVAYEQSPAMCDAIRKAGSKCDLITIEGGGHGMSKWEKDQAMQHWKPELVDWLKKTVGI